MPPLDKILTSDSLAGSRLKFNEAFDKADATETGLANETTARINAIRDTGVLPLASIAGTADAITAVISPSVAGVTLSVLSTVELIPALTNTAAVTLSVDGSAPWSVRRRDGTPVQAGDLRAGVSITLRRRGTTWRAIHSLDSDTDSKVAAEATARINATRDTGVLPLASIAGTADAITAVISPSVGVTLSVLSVVELIPALTNTAAVTLNVDEAGTWPVQRRDGTPVQAGDLRAGVSITLRRRGSAWRSIQPLDSDMDSKVAAERVVREGQIATLSDGLASVVEDAEVLNEPFYTFPSVNVNVLRTDELGRAIEVMRPTGLDAHMADEFWERAPEPAALSEPFAVVKGLGVTVMRVDDMGRAFEVMRQDGLDIAGMSQQFWTREAEAIADAVASHLDSGLLGGLSTTAVDIVSINGQSLTVSADYTTTVTRAGMLARVSPANLMLAGLRRGDGVAIADTLGPRSQGYDTATPSTGLVPAQPAVSIAGLPFAVATVLNDHRADAGAPQVPVLHSGHGISGIPIELMDDDPATGGTADTVVWNNLIYWSSEARRVVAAAGLTIRQPWYVWTHGTSAKSMLRGGYAAAWWDLQADTTAYYRSIGLPVPRWIITQSGGDANTVGDVWAVCDDQLDICEAGGAVLATPLYWYEIADNNVHPDGEGVALFGETYAWAMAEVEAGRHWTIIRPVASWDATASVLTLDFTSLREDEWLEVEAAAKYADHGGIGLGAAHIGFEVSGATLTSLTLRGRTVRLGCSAKPTQVRYAMQVQDMSSVAGNRYNAHRGLLRTSTRKPSKLVPGKLLVRAIPSFTLPIV